MNREFFSYIIFSVSFCFHIQFLQGENVIFFCVSVKEQKNEKIGHATNMKKKKRKNHAVDFEKAVSFVNE